MKQSTVTCLAPMPSEITARIFQIQDFLLPHQLPILLPPVQPNNAPSTYHYHHIRAMAAIAMILLVATNHHRPQLFLLLRTLTS